MDVPTGGLHILEWDEANVHNWFSGLGYPHYENQLREHRISGDVLCLLDSEGLKSIGVSTIGQRLAILKAVYQTKLAHNVPIEDDHYVPPSEASERTENISLDKLHSIVKEQEQRLRNVEEDNRMLRSALHSFTEEFNGLRNSLAKPGSEDSTTLRRQASFKWENFVKPQKSPTRPDIIESPHSSPHRLEHDISSHTRTLGQQVTATSSTVVDKPRPHVETTDSPNPNAVTPKAHRQESSDNLKSFKVSLEDPTWKVLPAALKKYRINNDSWQNYAMFICYGSAGNRIERCLSYDEKPLLLFQKLKDAKKNPVFMLKHIKDIRSPIAVAQQKHAARKASSVISTDTSITSATQGHHKAQSSSRAIDRPTKLEVSDISSATPSASLSPQPNWLEPSMLTPVDHTRVDELSVAPVSAGPQVSHALYSTASGTAHTGSISNTQDTSNPRIQVDAADSPNSGGLSAREMPVPSNGVSYAVAIYPYMAEQDDEFDVVVGDTFVILSRARGWWVVQRDPTGSGIVDTEISKQGWVPAGCLLETNVPVASAIAEATAAKGNARPGTPPHTPVSKTPILPLSIISTSFPGIALMDYKKKGEEELDLVKDDALRVFKRYNHWSYAVKEDGGDRGWVPSWFIGKITNTGNVPPTPGASTIYNGNGNHSTADDVNTSQVSPMSSAFPPVQSRAS